MRFRRLQLAAFGPFTDFELDFGAAARSDLQIVFGANEAGKSTALRAVRGLLFGIPERTDDAHRHPATELRVGAELVDESGRSLSVVRRRRRQGSLRDPSDAPLDERVLDDWLGGMDEPGFTRLFGFDHEDLKRAAEDMLAGKGELGELLFEAGAGGLGIGRVLKQLAEEEENLFTQKARTRRLNVLFKEFAEIRKELRDERVSPDAHALQAEGLAEAEREVERLKAHRAVLQAERTRLDRIARALGPIGRRRQCLLSLAPLEQIPELPEDVPERRRAAERERDEARHDLRVLTPDLELSHNRLAEMPADPPIAGLPAERARALADEAARAQARRREIVSKTEQLAELEREIARDVERLGLGSGLARARSLVLKAAELERARRIVDRHPALRASRDELLRRRAELAAREAELERGLGEPGSEAELERLARLQELVERCREGARREAELAARTTGLSLELSRHSERLRPAPPPEPVALPVPSEETLERFARRLSGLEAEQGRLGRALEECRTRLRDANRVLERMALEGGVPSEDELAQARAERDARLAEFVASGASQGLGSELGRLIALSDELADRLRREAARVAERAQAQAERAAAESEQGALEAARELTTAEIEQTNRDYRAAFAGAGVEPLSPEEMRPWLLRQRERVRLWDELDLQQRSLAELRRELSRGLGELGEGLAQPVAVRDLDELARRLTRSAQQAQSHVQATERARTELAVERARAAAIEAELELAERELASSERELTSSVMGLGLDAALRPEDVSRLLDQLGRFSERLELWPRLEAELARARSEVDAFEAELGELCASYAPELAALTAEARAAALLSAHTEALGRRREREQLVLHISDLEARLSAASSRGSAAEASLAELAVRAGLGSPDELATWEQGAGAKRKLLADLAELERELGEIAAGRTLDELFAEAASVPGDTLSARRAELDDELNDSEQALYAARRDVENKQAGLERLGHSNAAELAQRLAEKAAEIRAGALEYARLRLSRVILTREIASYRERHQAPILKRASELFARLSLGSVSGLAVGPDDRVLECQRGERGDRGQSAVAPVGVEALSEGTRYQLYFALRIASLERYLERGQPLPVVLDDVFIHFDDARAGVGLELLAELAERTQVLFFTHHERLVELAARFGNERVRCHELSRAPLRERAGVSEAAFVR